MTHYQPQQPENGQTTPPPLPGHPEVDWEPGQQPAGFNPNLPAWEQSGSSWLGAFCKTTWQVLFKPYITFQQTSYPGAASLIAFALPWTVLLTALTMLYSNPPVAFTVEIFLFCLIGAVVFFMVSILILHLALIIVRADKNGFKATFRANMYMCCGYIWLVIPWIGSLLAMVWIFVISFPVLAASQQVNKMRILGALLVYLAIIFCVFMVVIMIVGMAFVTQLINAMTQGAPIPLPWQ